MSAAGTRTTLVLIALALSPLACASQRAEAPPKRAPAPLADRWHYDLWLDRDLDTAVVRLCFYDPVPATLVARRKGRAFISDVRDDASNTKLARDGDAWVMRRGARCVRYKVDIAGAAALSLRPDLAARIGDAVVFTPELALLRPARTRLRAQMTMTVSTWGDKQVSTPWPRDEQGRYTFGFNTLWWRSYLAVGDLATVELEGGGAVLEVAFVDQRSFPEREKYERWLVSSADAVATLYGRLPADRLQVLVVPAPFPGSDPVMFGMVVRGGHPGALMLVRDDVAAADYMGEWVAVHELSHLALPFVQRDHMWMSEGFATWAQQVLRVRAGLLAEGAAWGRLLDGLERARDADVQRVPHVYWAGAGWWLLADLHLRERGSSLDEALLSMRACCFDAPRAASPDDVIARLSQVAPGFRAWADGTAPALHEAPARALEQLEQMGVVRDGEGVSLRADAPLARVREEMVRWRKDVLPTDL